MGTIKNFDKKKLPNETIELLSKPINVQLYYRHV